MDLWKYYGITHARHRICNPTSDAKLDELVDLLLLDRGRKVVDVASGKGEFLFRLAARHGIIGLGIDRSPWFVAEAGKLHADRGGDVTFLETDAADFIPKAGERFQMASCLGASFVFGGYRPTLERLASLVDDGGWIVSGEPYWRRNPPDAYLETLGCGRTTFGTHLENVRTGEDLGLDLCYTLVSSKDDFDRYEALQWYAADLYRREHPGDPDLEELFGKLVAERDAYLEWGRDTLGWAIYVFRRSNRP